MMHNDNAIPRHLKKRKLVDKSLPAGIPEITEEHALYEELQEMEKKLDWTMTRKRMEVQEAFGKTIKVRRKLRVFLSHTVTGQIWQENPSEPLDFDSGRSIPAWTFRIEGRLLDSNLQRLNKGPQRKFSSFLKSVIVEFDRDPNLYPEPNIVEWHKFQNQPSSQDGFEIKRRGDQSVKARVILHLDHLPDRFKVAPPLGDIIGVKEETRVGVVAALWNYIKTQGLQDKVDRRVIHLDPPLVAVLGANDIRFQHVPEVVNRFLQTADPIVLHHIINVDPPTGPNMQAFDIDIDMDDLAMKHKMNQVIVSFGAEANNAINALDDEIAQAAQSIRNSHLKKQFLESFAEDPQKFIQTWIASQSRDLEVILGEGADGGTRGVRDEDLRRSDFFKMPWVGEAVAIHEGLRTAGALKGHGAGAGGAGR